MSVCSLRVKALLSSIQAMAALSCGWLFTWIVSRRGHKQRRGSPDHNAEVADDPYSGVEEGNGGGDYGGGRSIVVLRLVHFSSEESSSDGKDSDPVRGHVGGRSWH